MSLLDDPSMREIVIDFCDEALSLFDELEQHLEALESDPTETAHLEEYGQIIDRVMGAAKSIGADEIATFCELGKTIGYKSSQTKDEALLEVVAAVLFDATDILRKMVTSTKTGNDAALKNLNTNAFVTRLRWLSEKFKDIDRASVQYQEPTNLSQTSIDELMANLGL